MGNLMIRCPKTGRSIRTQYEIDPQRFLSLPVFFARSYCPICQLEHEWFAGNAWVVEHDLDGKDAARVVVEAVGDSSAESGHAGLHCPVRWPVTPRTCCGIKNQRKQSDEVA